MVLFEEGVTGCHCHLILQADLLTICIDQSTYLSDVQAGVEKCPVNIHCALLSHYHFLKTVYPFFHQMQCKQFFANKTFLWIPLSLLSTESLFAALIRGCQNHCLHELYLSACPPVTILQTTDYLQTAITSNSVPMLTHMPSRQEYWNCWTPQGLSRQSNEASLPTTETIF